MGADNLITTTVPADCLNPNSSTIGLSVAELIQLILRCADGYCHNGDSSWKEGTFSLGYRFPRTTAHGSNVVFETFCQWTK